MSFGMRHWLMCFKSMLKSSGKIFAVALGFGAVVGVLEMVSNSDFSADRIVDMLCLMAVIAVVVLLFIAMIATFYHASNAKLNTLLNTCGYCAEYRMAYEQEKLATDKASLVDCIGYIQVLSRCGYPQDALSYATNLWVPEDRPSVTCLYIYNCAEAAARAGQPQLAERLIYDRGGFISSVLENGAADCRYFAGMAVCTVHAMCGRFAQALPFADAALRSKGIPHEDMLDARIMRLYILNMLGMTAEASAAAEEIVRELDNVKPLFDWRRQQLINEYNMAMNGRMPM